MGDVLLLLAVALTVAAVVFGVTVLVSGHDPGLVPAEPDGRAVPLPGSRPLRESDIAEARFDTALRGYRMAQVDQAMRRAAYDIGYKSELVNVLEAEVTALREGRTADADALRRAREEAAGGSPEVIGTPTPADAPVPDDAGPAGQSAEPTAPAAGPTASSDGTPVTVRSADAGTVATDPTAAEDRTRERDAVVRSESA